MEGKKAGGGQSGKKKDREREEGVGPTRRRLHDGIKSFVGINDNDDNEAACHRRVGRAIIVRRRISQSLLGNLFFATGVRDNVPVFLSGSSDDVLLFVPPFFPSRASFAGRNGKSRKIDESAFYINIFKEISLMVLRVAKR